MSDSEDEGSSLGVRRATGNFPRYSNKENLAKNSNVLVDSSSGRLKDEKSLNSNLRNMSKESNIGEHINPDFDFLMQF
jgi:hypothetical protein